MAAIGHARPLELEAWREELRTVLDSRPFRQAPTLSHLLSYLCEKLFAGESNQIKEYSIAVEMFRRGAEFDQETDSIVRVEVNRLRKRLADYYAGEGASHRLQIVIPVGQYVPKFVSTEPEPEPNPEPPKTAAARPASWLRRRWWLVPAVLGGTAVGVAVWVTTRHAPPPQETSVARAPAQAAEEGLVGPPPGDEVRLLAGSTRSYVDHADKMWKADAWFSGGAAVKNEVRYVSRTLDPGFYRTSREGQFRYDIPLKPGTYELHLHFAETEYGPANMGVGGEGSRLMTVRANGQTLLSNFDVLADAGGERIADDRVFPGLSPASDGKLHLEFAGENGANATLSAIEILPGFGTHIRPVRLLARQTPYYSNDSRWWSPDNYFEGGQMASYVEPVNGTDDPELYETERWGNFTYAIPAAPGRYAVTLYFTARHRGWNEPLDPGTPAGEQETRVEHIFNVFCNGRAILENFDLAKEARGSDVVVRRVTGLEPNAQGKLLLSFVPVKGYASVTGIEVVQE
ncbi:MAG: malectin domain-containing carbohydrate-binding protein [Acidobacteriota bacterium]